MKNAVTPAEIIALGVKRVFEILYPIIYHQDAQRRAEKIVQLAQNSASVEVAQQSQVLSLRMSLQRLELLEQQQQQIEQQMLKYLQEVPYAELLLTIPDMGKITRACILGEIGDILDYNHAN